MMMQKIFKIVLLTLVALSIGCGKKPLFDMLSGSKVHVIVKGTYESNNPRVWTTTVNNDDSMGIIPPNFVQGSIAAYNNPAYFPSIFKLDVAEIRIDGEKFANNRRLFRCSTTDSEPFFDGTGIDFTSNDVVPGKTYSSIQMFTRKMIFDHAYSFDPISAAFLGNVQTLFNEEKEDGFDFNPVQSLCMWDTLRMEQYYTNRIFPVNIPISGGFNFDGDNEWVLEIRIVVKNMVKRYETVHTDGDTYQIYHFFGLSDFASEVQYGDSYIGGNLYGVARAYRPDHVGTIIGSATGQIVIAIPEFSPITDYIAPSSSRPNDGFMPKAPVSTGSDFLSSLEYLAKYERYKAAYGAFVAHVITTFDFVSTWDGYQADRDKFKIPMLATYDNGSGYTITNVPPGRYDVYRGTPVSGGLPTSYTSIGTVTVTVP
jgi:hypothetical protein